MAKRKKQPDQRDMSQRLWDRLILCWRLIADRRVELMHKLIPLLGLLYILSPLDFIPDVLLPVGVADDIGVAILALEMFIRMAPVEVVREHQNALKGRFDQEPEAEFPSNSDPDNVIEGKYRVDD